MQSPHATPSPSHHPSHHRPSGDSTLDTTSQANETRPAAKGTLKSERLSDNKDLNTLQDDLADTGGGLVGKGGLGEKVGSTLSQGL